MPRGKVTSVPQKELPVRLSIIAAIGTDGSSSVSITTCTTDNEVFSAYLYDLVRELELARPGFRQNTVFMTDGASYNVHWRPRKLLQKLGLKVIQTGPYACSSSPIEFFNSQLPYCSLCQC